ncbi:unnamed protein product [Linum tenue]|uniref:RRM domain-containing protein n=1 Tax=Linum tenue TaxID=586396 RepID=A0AAV0QR82_9ROSI|nr:unnamed protein product [Linum tenue]
MASSSTFTRASMAESCLLSLPSIITTPRTPLLALSIPSRPLKLHLSHSLSLRPTTHLRFPSLIPFVAQTSDWAQQDEQNTTATIADSEQGDGEGSSWENEGEDSAGDGIEAQEPPEDAKVFVGNLPYDVDSEKLAMLFEQAGTVEIAEVIYNRETDSSRGFGFVTMSTVEEADKAVDMFSSYDMGGRLLTVNKAAPRGSRPERAPRVFEPGCRVYVGNLPWSVDDARLEQVFSEHGKVTSARVVYDRDSGRSRGFGFVTMADETEMNDAIAALDGQVYMHLCIYVIVCWFVVAIKSEVLSNVFFCMQSLDGRAIRVNVAEERPRRSF